MSELTQDPWALFRISAEFEGLLQHFGPTLDEHPGPSSSTVIEAHGPSDSSDDGEAFPRSGVLFSDSQLSRILVPASSCGRQGSLDASLQRISKSQGPAYHCFHLGLGPSQRLLLPRWAG